MVVTILVVTTRKYIDLVNSICNLLEDLKLGKPMDVKMYQYLITLLSDRPVRETRYAIDACKIKDTLG